MSTTQWRRRPDVLWRRSLDTIVFLPPGLTEPRNLGGSGPAVWELLAEWRSFDDLVTVLAGVHGTEPATISADVQALLEELAELGAVTTDGGPEGPAEKDPSGAG